MKTTEVAQHLSTGESRLPNWLRKVLAQVNSYQSGRLPIAGCLNQATTKICRRDMRQQFSSLLSLLMMVGLVSSDLSYCSVCPAGRGWEGGGWG
jgi:hypothetical protein